MPWTTITEQRKDLDEAVASFESGVTSIDSFSVAGHGHNRVTALIEYTA
jgi:hypothetical protein